MNLENTFYILGIIYMVISTTIMVVVAVYLYRLKTRFDAFEDRVGHLVQFAAPATSAIGIGSFVVSKVLDIFKSRKSK